MLQKAQANQLAVAAEMMRRQNSTPYSTPPSPSTSPLEQERRRASVQSDSKMGLAPSMLDLTAHRQRDVSPSEARKVQNDGSVGPLSTSSSASSYGQRNSCSSPRDQNVDVDSA